MSELRSEVVEAMAQVLAVRQYGTVDAPKPSDDILWLELMADAEAALDAALDMLEERREEWWVAAGGFIGRGVLWRTGPTSQPNLELLIASLRTPAEKATHNR